jgi:hypothetical protein
VPVALAPPPIASNPLLELLVLLEQLTSPSSSALTQRPSTDCMTGSPSSIE